MSDRLARPYIEYGLTEHCNLKCHHCTVYAPYLKPSFAEIESYRKDVIELAKHIRVNRFRLLGGEPLMHKHVIEFLQIAKDSGIGKSVGVCTNGELAPKMSEEFWQTIQFIDISVYPTSRIDYIEVLNLIKDKQQKYGFTMRTLRHKDTFQIVNVDEEITDTVRIQKIFDTCDMAHSWSCHHIFEGRYYLCAKPCYQNKYFDRVGIKTDINYREADGLTIHEPNFRQRLEARLKDNTPLKACAFCLGSSGPKFKGKQLTKEEIDAHLGVKE